MRCPGCGRENADHYKFCLACGVELKAPPGEAADDGERARRIARLMEEAREFERLGLFNRAIGRLEQVVALEPDDPMHQLELDALRLRAGKVRP